MICPWDPLEYLRFRRSAQWQVLRQACFARDNWECVVCGAGTHLQGHHKVYRLRPELTRLEDLETRCEKHHEAFHERKRRGRQSEKRIFRLQQKRFERGRQDRKQYRT